MRVRLFESKDQQIWDNYVLNHPAGTHNHLCGWKHIIERTYNKKGYYLIAEKDQAPVGLLPLFHIKSLILGNQLVSMPYLNYGGILADSEEVEEILLEQSMSLLGELNADYLELRQSKIIPEKILNNKKYKLNSFKVKMILNLLNSSELLLNSFKSKLRSQIRRPVKEGMNFVSGSSELVDDFYHVFSINMRDLGSPVHAKKLFENICNTFNDQAIIGVVYSQKRPVAGGMITIFNEVAEIPWASSLREYNRYSPNMLLYWSFMEFVIKNNGRYFDFGRSTPGEGTFRFKEQWGAQPTPLYWYQFFLNEHYADNAGLQPDSKLRSRLASGWEKLPLTMANYFGPIIRKNISL